MGVIHKFEIENGSTISLVLIVEIFLKGVKTIVFAGNTVFEYDIWIVLVFRVLNLP